MKRLFLYLLFIILSVTAILSILGYFGANSWQLDLFSHFKVQYLSILLPGTLVLVFLKKRIYLIFLPFILLLIYEIQGLYHGGNKSDKLTSTAKILCINLLSSNNKSEDVIRYIQEKSPDIVIFLEFTERWQAMLEPDLRGFDHSLKIPRIDNFGIAIYSKIDFFNLKRLNIGQVDAPSIQADFMMDNSKVSLIATHPLPPINDYYFENRNLQLQELSKYVSDLDQHVIIVGDLNTSSFSVHFKKLINESKLVDSRKGFGLQLTWPTWFELAGTTLDHCLISKEIKIKSRDVGEDIGSDHFPIFIEFGLR